MVRGDADKREMMRTNERLCGQMRDDAGKNGMMRANVRFFGRTRVRESAPPSAAAAAFGLGVLAERRHALFAVFQKPHHFFFE